MATSADPDPSAFDLLVRCPAPISRPQLRVDFSPVYDRQPHPDAQLEETIHKVWEQRIAAQPSLFSASKFRAHKIMHFYNRWVCHQCSLHTSRSRNSQESTIAEQDLLGVYGGFEVIGQEGQDNPIVVLRLGLTDYKTFVGTNLSPRWGNFLAPSPDDASRCKHTADPLGNGAIVETADHKILILQRSTDVGEFPGYTVFPGGHSEPDEVGIISHLVRDASSSAELNNRIAEEMFDGIIREIVEETGVPSIHLSDAVFIGVSRRRLNVRPTAFFCVQCSLTSAEVMEVYRHAEHSFESTVLLSSTPDALLQGAGRKMPGCHHGGAALYQMMRDELADRPKPP